MELSGDSNEASRAARSLAVTSVGVARIRESAETDSLPVRFSRRTWNEPSFWREIPATHVEVRSAGPSLFARARTRVSLPWRKDCRIGRSRGPFFDFEA